MKVALEFMKKAIVLMMTLGFISIITALVIYTLSISEKSFHVVAGIDAQNQFSLVFKDFTKIIKANTKDVNDSDTLSMFLSMSLPPIKEPKSGLEVGLLVDSRMSKININSLLTSLLPSEGNCDLNDTTDKLCRPLNRFFEKYEIRDKILLEQLMLDTVDKDDIELGTMTEIASEDIDFSQGKIYNYTHLKKIFDAYYKLTSDKNIFRITQERVEDYFYFGDTNESKQMLDCDALDVQNAMNLILPSNFISDSIGVQDYCAMFNQNDPELKEIKKLFSIKQFDLNDTKSKYLIKCNLIFNTDTVNRSLVFDYDIKNKRIDSIEKPIFE